MKRVMIVAVVGVALTIIGTRWLSSNASLQASGASQPSLEPTLTQTHWGVNDFMSLPEPPDGAVSIEGVVAGADGERGLLSLLDTAEFTECRITSCARLYLPVRWTGPMPTVEQRVAIEGRVGAQEGKLIFLAEKVEKLNPPVERATR